MTERDAAAGGAYASDAPDTADAPSLARRLGIAAAALVVLAALGAFLWYRAGAERRRADAEMTEALDHLVTAQEGFFYDSGRYVTSLAALPALAKPPGVRLEILGASPRSWWGAATHERVAGRRCVVWVGDPAASMPADAKDPSRETIPTCANVDAGAKRAGGRAR